MNKKLIGIALAATMMSGFAARSYAEVPNAASALTLEQVQDLGPIYEVGPIVVRPAGGNECLPSAVVALAAIAYDYTKKQWFPGPIVVGPRPSDRAFDRP